MNKIDRKNIKPSVISQLMENPEENKAMLLLDSRVKPKNGNETGRSMVEMLGVLAIIGVLSVMGIAGYTQAMKSYRGNEIVNATSMLYMMGQSANGGEEATADLAYTTAFGTEPTGVSSLTYKPNGTITMTISDSDICADVTNKLGDKVTEGECQTSGNSSLTVALGEVKEPTIANPPTS